MLVLCTPVRPSWSGSFPSRPSGYPVFNWGGGVASPQELTDEVFTPSRKGSLQSAMVAAARRHDRTACLLAEPADLIDKITAGHSVIVLV